MASISLKQQTFLVIGGCGYFGFRVVRWLIVEEQVDPGNLVVLDLGQPPPTRRVPGVQYMKSDITDRASVFEVVSKVQPSILIHTASPPYYLGKFEAFMLNNVEGTRNLLDAAVATLATRVFIYTSSSSVIHDYVSDMFEGNESHPLLLMPEQRQPYHHSKAVAEELAMGYNRKRDDFVVAAIRPSAMFGPGESNMIPSMVERAKRGTLRYQIGNGKNCADFTYVDNTVHGLVLTVYKLLEALRDGPHALPAGKRVEGEPFAITNDVHANFWDFARNVGAAAGYPTDPTRIVSIPKSVGLGVATLVEWLVWLCSFGTRQSKIRRMDVNYSTITRTLDISKAKTRLGYRPRFTLDEGIELAVAPLHKSKKDN